MTTNSHQQPIRKKTKQKENQNELSKQLEQEQINRNGDHMEDYQQGGGGKRWGGRYRE